MPQLHKHVNAVSGQWRRVIRHGQSRIIQNPTSHLDFKTKVKSLLFKDINYDNDEVLNNIFE
jgi:hypothetical protein